MISSLLSGRQPGPCRLLPLIDFLRGPEYGPAAGADHGVSVARAPLDKELATAGEIEELPDRCGGHEAGTDEAMFEHLGDPGADPEVDFALGHLGDLLGQAVALDSLVGSAEGGRDCDGWLVDDSGHESWCNDLSDRHDERR